MLNNDLTLFNLAEFKVKRTLQEVSVEDQSPRSLIEKYLLEKSIKIRKQMRNTFENLL